MDRFLIAPYDNNSGLQTEVRPWLIPDQAFSQLNNAYVFRGRIRKRFGSRWMSETSLGSRLRVAVGTNGVPISPVPGGGTNAAIGQMFSIGDDIFTVWQANGAMLSTNPLANGTFNTATGVFAINDPSQAAGTTIYWYPGLPVMGLLTYDLLTVNNEFTIGFDTRYAYQFTTTGWERLAGETTAGTATWSGNNAQFFWGTTWTGANAFDRIFFVTNFNELEPNYMRTFDGVTGLWTIFRPPITATPDYLNSARIIVPFKNRLLAFNTWEGPDLITQQNYPNRVRYSQSNASPLAADAWRQDIKGKGNAVDCPTVEAIVTVEFVRDRLIVYFERSTWELVYTANQAYPFAWQQINTELGAESTFSIIPFDKVAIGVGNVGIHACNGTFVERIDQKIPDTVFDIHNLNSGVERVYGIRDYFVEMIYWTFPDEEATALFPFPNRVLTFNYKTGTWAFNFDSITVFGYWQSQVNTTWDSTTVTWDDDEPWDGASTQALFRQVVAGNQEGYTFIIDPECTINVAVLQITNMTNVAVGTTNTITVTAINHNLQQDDFVYLQDIAVPLANFGFDVLNDTIFKIVNDTSATPNTFVIIFDDGSTVINQLYTGGGLISRVSNIEITTKEYNFYAKDGRNASVSRIDFLVDREGVTLVDGSNDGSSIQVNFFASTSLNNLLTDGAATGALQGTGTLDLFAYNNIYPYEATATRLWHPVYFQADGEVIAFQLQFNDTQMLNTTIREADFQLHAILIMAQPTSNRLQ